MPDPLYDKLHNVFGPDRARQLFDDTLAEIRLTELRNAGDRLRFGSALLRHGGVLAAIGRSIRVQAILQGARD